MNEASLSWTTLAVLLLALTTAAGLLRLPRKSDAEVLFAVFCGSLALSMLRPGIAPDGGFLWWLVAIGSSATCNAYWLVARALFRGDGAVRIGHAAVALVVALLIVLWRLLGPAVGESVSPQMAILSSLLSLASAAMLVLAFAEGLRGFGSNLPISERRLRIGFLIVFGGCVLTGTISRALAEALPEVAALQPTIVSLCALSIVAYTVVALGIRRRQRLQHPDTRPAPATVEGDTPSATLEGDRLASTFEDQALAAAILRLIEVDAVYLDPELKVADLAHRLDSAEHRVSRAITHGLGERNFNRLVNRYRIRHACQLLDQPDQAASVLEISAAAGFASLGPFNRAFKEATGLTPTVYRRRSQPADTLTDTADAITP